MLNNPPRKTTASARISAPSRLTSDTARLTSEASTLVSAADTGFPTIATNTTHSAVPDTGDLALYETDDDDGEHVSKDHSENTKTSNKPTALSHLNGKFTLSVYLVPHFSIVSTVDTPISVPEAKPVQNLRKKDDEKMTVNSIKRKADTASAEDTDDARVTDNKPNPRPTKRRRKQVPEAEADLTLTATALSSSTRQKRYHAKRNRKGPMSALVSKEIDFDEIPDDSLVKDGQRSSSPLARKGASKAAPKPVQKKPAGPKRHQAPQEEDKKDNPDTHQLNADAQDQPAPRKLAPTNPQGVASRSKREKVTSSLPVMTMCILYPHSSPEPKPAQTVVLH